MKKCPKCHAEIEENARFCLYCMTSFEEKKPIESQNENHKRWLYMLAVVFVLVFVGCCIFAFTRTDNPPVSSSSTSTYTESPTTSNNDSVIAKNSSTISRDPLQNSESATNVSSTPSRDKDQAQKSTSETGNNTTSNKTNTKNRTPANSTTNNTNTKNDTSVNATTNNTSSKNIISSVNHTSSKNNTPADSTTTGTVSKNSTTTQPNYSYIEATIENTYPTDYTAMYAPENAIVITKVNYKEKSGNYVIPDTIDGKKVAAIMPLAFCDASISPTVKSVTLPSTVRTIWNNAFKDCYNLKDIYIKSGVIGIYTDAFPVTAKRTDTLTIHCSRDCRNFDFYYYRNIADNYDAKYDEWND